MSRYNPSEIEPKWQKIWDETKLYEVREDPSRKKIYATPMFPYPSGAGLHIGHGRNYSIADVVARFYRQRGYNVMTNIGWDAFGLPTENYAIKAGLTPQEATKHNIKHFKNQLKRFGMSYDWSREINTTDPSYYKWTQWIFTQLYKEGLAYQGISQQWWCDQCKTVLANEQVVEGKCWRHDSPEDPPVTRRETKQWFFKITNYADELLEHTDELDWPEGIKTMQKNWIGKSQGAEVKFKVDGAEDLISVFTTRPDTLFGATYMVLAPEHELVSQLTTESTKAKVEQYVEQAKSKSELQRKQAEKDKTGVFTGSYAVNPVSNEKIPIWIADYVLGGYGTGAIMAVPAHDQRDYEFARKFDLPIREVITATTGEEQENPEFRRSIVAIVRNDKGEYLTVDWGNKGGNLFIGGGIDDGEDIVETAKREIAEETGYLDVEFISQTEKIIHSYFAYSKNVPRRIEAYGLLFDLKSGRREEQQLEEDEKGSFTVRWLPQNEVETKVTEGLHQGVYDRLVRDQVYVGEGVLKNSGEYDGVSSSRAREKIVADLSAKNLAEFKVNYRMRDMLISRQRYWGAPIPIIHCEKCGSVPVPEQDLPVVLPEVKNFQPTGGGTSVLAEIDEWVNVECPECSGKAKRETDTMDGYACSSWYMYRYTDANNDKQAWDKEKANYWLPVDFYFGGDHAVSHLLYVRFWNKFFADQGLIDKELREPVKKLVFNGYINAEDGSKMSKSRGNVVDPLEVIDSGYGADALRLYELFIAPYDQDAAWNTNGVPGMYRYLNRLWDFVQEFREAKPSDATLNTELEAAVMSSVHKAIKKVTEDLDDLSFNTAIAAQMKLNNELRDLLSDLPFGSALNVWKDAISMSLQLLAPFAPHMAEELWSQLGYEESIHVDGWPAWDEELVKEEITTIVVQINGKVRANIELPADVSEDEMVAAARANEKIVSYLKDGEVVKTITVPGKIVNFVVKG